MENKNFIHQLASIPKTLFQVKDEYDHCAVPWRPI